MVNSRCVSSQWQVCVVATAVCHNTADIIAHKHFMAFQNRLTKTDQLSFLLCFQLEILKKKKKIEKVLLELP